LSWFSTDIKKEKLAAKEKTHESYGQLLLALLRIVIKSCEMIDHYAAASGAHSFVRLVILAKEGWRRKLRGSRRAARERKRITEMKSEIKKGSKAVHDFQNVVLCFILRQAF
jgi:hypothetical protein